MTPTMRRPAADNALHARQCPRCHRHIDRRDVGYHIGTGPLYMTACANCAYGAFGRTAAESVARFNAGADRPAVDNATGKPAPRSRHDH